MSLGKLLDIMASSDIDIYWRERLPSKIPIGGMAFFGEYVLILWPSGRNKMYIYRSNKAELITKEFPSWEIDVPQYCLFRNLQRINKHQYTGELLWFIGLYSGEIEFAEIIRIFQDIHVFMATFNQPIEEDGKYYGYGELSVKTKYSCGTLYFLTEYIHSFLENIYQPLPQEIVDLKAPQSLSFKISNKRFELSVVNSFLLCGMDNQIVMVGDERYRFINWSDFLEYALGEPVGGEDLDELEGMADVYSEIFWDAFEKIRKIEQYSHEK